MIRNDRALSRQQLIDKWFEKFVDYELYDDDDYHRFCKRMASKSQLEIERIFQREKH